MTRCISYAALGFALVAGTSLAQAQTVETVISQPAIVPSVVVVPSAQIVETVPVQTVQTVQTVRTVQPVRPVAAPRQRTVAAGSFRHLYEVATPMPAATAVVQAAPGITTAVVTPVPAYHYVYEPGRILVVDNATGVAVQALPR